MHSPWRALLTLQVRSTIWRTIGRLFEIGHSTMLNFEDTQEENVTSLDDLLSGTASSVSEYVALVGSNAGRPALAITVTMPEAIKKTQVYNDPDHPEESAQRELNDSHANGLAAYVLHSAANAAVAERKRLGKVVPAEFQQIVDLMG